MSDRLEPSEREYLEGLRYEDKFPDQPTHDDKPKHKHAFRFDGDDPYLICDCGQYEDAMTGRVITYGKYYKEPITTPKVNSHDDTTEPNPDTQSNEEWSWQGLDNESFRQVIFVRYPSTMTIQTINELLEWAKWRKVQSLYDDGCLVMCGVKPPYMKHFLKDNADYVIKHKAMQGDEDIFYDVEGGIYG